MSFVLALCFVAVRRDVLPRTYFAFALLLLLLRFALFVVALALAAVYGYSQLAVIRQRLALVVLEIVRNYFVSPWGSLLVMSARFGPLG